MAATKHVIRLSAIANFFAEANERKLLARGENAVASNHVKAYHFMPEILMLKGEIHASMRDRTYNVEVNFFKDGEIKDASCTCPRGQFVCHHVAALLLYVHHNVSVTDIECRWAAKKSKEDNVQTIDDIYVTKSHVSTDRQLTPQEIQEFCSSLQEFGTAVGFTWLLRPEPTMVASLINDVEELIFSEEYFTSKDKKKYVLHKMAISPKIVQRVVSATVGQSRNENWLLARKNRLTASNFGIVLSAMKRNKFPQSLFRRLTGFYNLENVKAIQWGIIHEGTAIQEFTAETGRQVPTGLWLHSCGFLGASPDGFVGADAMIEVKCPYKFREKIISSELKTDHSYIIYFDDKDKMMVNKNHEYFHQIQGNLAISEKETCYLFVWTPRENLLIETEKDPGWSENVALLQNFYLDHYLPRIVTNVIEDV